MQRLGRLGLANETAVIDLAAAAPAAQRRAVTRTATHAATPRAAWQRRCSPERWTDDSSPTSTVFPTDSAGAPRDSWRDKGRSRPRIEAAATFAAKRRPSTEREGMAMAEIAGTDASRALLINDRAKLSRERASASKHGDAPSFRAAMRVVSDRTAPTTPQHLSGGCGSRAMGSKPLATGQRSSFRLTRIVIQHGCRSLEPSAVELVSSQWETPTIA